MKPRLGPDTAIIVIIAAFTVFRLVMSATLGFGTDESYGVGVAHDLQLSYYDHPPLHYWIVYAFLPLLGDGHAARLPFIALFAGSCWLLYRLTRRLFSAEAGVVAVFAINVSAFFAVAGGWVLPDGPLLFALLAAALVLARMLFPAAGEQPPSMWSTWLQAGFWIGVAGLSKYHAVLFTAGLLIFLASMPGRRRMMWHPAPWVGALIALIVISPVLIWNMQNDWVSVGYQAVRSEASGLHIGNFLANIGGQAGYLLPWIFVPLVTAVWYALRGGRGTERAWYCLCLGLPTVAVFTLIPLWGDRGLPHWPMPGWLFLYPVLGDYAVRLLPPLRVRRWLAISCALLVLLAVVIVGHAVTGFGRILAPALFAKGDLTLESLEWTTLPAELKARGLSLQPGLFIVTTDAIYAAGKIDQAIDSTLPVLVFRNNPKQYGFRHDLNSFVGHDAIVIGRPVPISLMIGDLRPYFDSVEELAPITLGRSGMQEIELRVFRAHDLKRPLPFCAALLRGSRTCD